jgi:hypothetical protein
MDTFISAAHREGADPKQIPPNAWTPDYTRKTVGCTVCWRFSGPVMERKLAATLLPSNTKKQRQTAFSFPQGGGKDTEEVRLEILAESQGVVDGRMNVAGGDRVANSVETESGAGIRLGFTGEESIIVEPAGIG